MYNILKSTKTIPDKWLFKNDPKLNENKLGNTAIYTIYELSVTFNM